MKILLILLLLVGCAGSSKVNGDKKALEKALQDAVAAEKELSKLRQERMRLEKELGIKSE